MSTVNAVSSSQTALSLLSREPARQSPASNQAAVSRLSPLSALRTSSGVSDAIMTIKELIQEKEALSSEEQAIMSRFGADSISKRQPEQLERADFINAVKAWLEPDYKDDAGYQQAKKNGTLNIQRAIDVPESGFRAYIYDLKSGGRQIGSVGWMTINDAWYDAQIRAGKSVVFGMKQDQGFLVSW